MANRKLLETVPSETGVLKVVWRLDSNGSGGMNQYSIPLFVQNKYLLVVGVSGSATLSVNQYLDLGDVGEAPTDFPPAGLVLLSTLGPISVSAGGSSVFELPPYINFIEPTVSNVAGSFVAYVVVTGTL